MKVFAFFFVQLWTSYANWVVFWDDTNGTEPHNRSKMYSWPYVCPGLYLIFSGIDTLLVCLLSPPTRSFPMCTSQCHTLCILFQKNTHIFSSHYLKTAKSLCVLGIYKIASVFLFGRFTSESFKKKRTIIMTALSIIIIWTNMETGMDPPAANQMQAQGAHHNYVPHPPPG